MKFRQEWALQLCVCRHRHAASSFCPVCGCQRFRLDPGEGGRIARMEANLAKEFEGRNFISAEEAEHVSAMLDAQERTIMERMPWDQLPPMLVAVYLSRGPQRADGAVSLRVEWGQMQFPPGFWSQVGGYPGALLEAMARQALNEPRWWANLRRTAGLDPRRLILGWCFAFEGYVRKKGAHADEGDAVELPHLREDEMRGLDMVDIDGRMYHVQHTRYGTYPRSVGVLTPREWAETDKSAMSEAGYDPEPRATAALQTLSRVTARQQEMQGLFDQWTPLEGT